MSARRNWRVLAQDDTGNRVALECRGTDFDELVVDGFLHLEKLNARDWCLIINGPDPKGARIHLTIREAGRKTMPFVTVVDGAELVRR